MLFSQCFAEDPFDDFIECLDIDWAVFTPESSFESSERFLFEYLRQLLHEHSSRVAVRVPHGCVHLAFERRHVEHLTSGNVGSEIEHLFVNVEVDTVFSGGKALTGHGVTCLGELREAFTEPIN